MDVAIRGDRASCLSVRLGPHAWLFAVARGFGTLDGLPAAAAALRRLRAECERRSRGERFRRALERPQAAAAALLGVFSRVNGDLFTLGAGHDDYVTAGCSLSAAFVVRDRAYVMHAGSTAAYVSHRGEIAALTADDALDEGAGVVLARALGTAPVLDLAVTTVQLEPGDVVLLIGHRVPGDVDRRALIAHVEEAGSGEQVLVARFGDDDRVNDEPTVPRRAPFAHMLRHAGAAVAWCVLLILFARGGVH